MKISDKLSIKAGLGYEYNYYDLTGMIRFQDVPIYANYYRTKMIKTDCHLRLDFLNKSNTLSFYSFAGPTINTSFYEWADFGYWGIQENKGLQVYNLLIMGGLGFGLTIKQTIIFNIEPAYMTAIWRNEKNAEHILSDRLGLNFGLTYKLKK